MSDFDPALVAALGQPDAYADDPSASEGVEHVQTHLSHVFLTRERVYKLHKAVRFSFVDFGERRLRNEDALRELLLNRRMAPDVYVGLRPVWLEREEQGAVARGSGAAQGERERCAERARVRMGPLADALWTRSPDGSIPEHCLIMRRLPGGRDALSLLERRALTPGHLARAVARIARFHLAHGLGMPAPFDSQEWWRRNVEPALACFEELKKSNVAERSAKCASGLAARAEVLRPRFEARRLAGRAVDGHGDLHLPHVWFERDDRDPVVIDCIAFRDDFRQIDAASDIAFLAMDLQYRGKQILADYVLGEYALHTSDHDLFGVVDFFIAYRAAVRAKVAALAAADPEVDPAQRDQAAESAHRHLSQVEAALADRRPGAVVVLCGRVGTGKSSVARALAERAGGVTIASDRVRKARAGLAPTERVTPEARARLYSPEVTGLVYRDLAARALDVARSGRLAILDATYASRALRDPLRQELERAGVRGFLIETLCTRDVALARLAERQRRDADPSDAGPEVYREGESRYEPPSEWPEGDRAIARTDTTDWLSQLGDTLRRLERAGSC